MNVTVLKKSSPQISLRERLVAEDAKSSNERSNC